MSKCYQVDDTSQLWAGQVEPQGKQKVQRGFDEHIPGHGGVEAINHTLLSIQ